jgi:hypothetical protein
LTSIVIPDNVVSIYGSGAVEAAIAAAERADERAAAGEPPLPEPAPSPEFSAFSAFYGCTSLTNAMYNGQIYSVISWETSWGHIIVDLPKAFYDTVNGW